MTDSDTTRSPNPPAGGAWAPGGSTEPPPDGSTEPRPQPGGEPPLPPGGEPPLPPGGEPQRPPAAPQPSRASSPPPASAWRPPPSDSGRNASLFFGAILLVIGVWFFATRTLGLDLPDLDWGSLWPLILIGIGAWIVVGALRQRSR